MPVRGRESEQGFTMITTILATTLMAMLVLVAVTSVNGDVHQVRNDLAHKQAYEAAKAGIDDYAFHLHANGNYWGLCTSVPKPNAVNQIGTVQSGEATKRFVPGSTSATYAIELIPAQGQTKCDVNHPTTSMIETSGVMKGTFRIRSTGFAEKTQVSITTTFKTASFLDYVYFTQLETLDPVTFGYPNPSTELENAYKQCSLTRQEGRYNQNIPGTSPAAGCEEIIFKGGDVINGPLHSNDALAICDSPTFGRTTLDVIEVSALENADQNPEGLVQRRRLHRQPDLQRHLGDRRRDADPAGDQRRTQKHHRTHLQVHRAGADLPQRDLDEGRLGQRQQQRLLGRRPLLGPDPGQRARLRLERDLLDPVLAVHRHLPDDLGVRDRVRPRHLHGAADDRGGERHRHRQPALPRLLLGSQRQRHARADRQQLRPRLPRLPIRDRSPPASDRNPQCGSSTEKKVSNLTIDAAILSINHSFIVDHYDCGTSLGTLTVRGAISQKFRGPVGRGTPGYIKSYNYDDRLKYLEPPSFIEPEKLPWVIGRETIG